ncbi:Uncharacterised protein [uncultured Clostridium sp.]|nr:Uncharacterised protein [uncultured Clostridium sp.]
MGKGLLVQGGGGGTSSDDLTAKKMQVLEGYTAVTNDSDDEAIEGGMKNLTDRAKITHAATNNTKVVLGDTAYISTNSDGTTRAEIRYNGDEGFITSNTLIAIDQGSMATAGNLTAAKIAKGESAFGINGTYTSDANATADKILTGFSGYVNGSKINGDMLNQGTKTASLNCGGSYVIPKGFHDGNGKVTANSLSSQTDATATAPYIYKGKTAWVKGSKLTGTLTTTSAINFSAAARSYNTIRISWTNPSKGPWSGVFIQMSTSGNPGTGGGTRAYTGKGENGSQAGGSNYVDINGLNYETKYYFTCTSYTHFNEINHDEWGTSYNVSATTPEWWDPNSSGSMSIWVSSSKFPNVLKDVDGKFKNMAWSNEGAKAIAGSAYALNALGKNSRACMYMNLSPYVPNYYDTIVSTLQNTGYFTKKSTFSESSTYEQGSSGKYTAQIIYSGYPSGRKFTNGNSFSPGNDTGTIVVITKYACGFNGVTTPTSGFSGADIRYAGNEKYNNMSLDMVFKKGRYYTKLEKVDSYNNYIKAGLSATWAKRYAQWDSVDDGRVTFTENKVCFGPAQIDTSCSDDNTYAYTYWWGNLYRCN